MNSVFTLKKKEYCKLLLYIIKQTQNERVFLLIP